MPIAYERDDARRRVVLTAEGPFQVDEMLEMLDRQRQDGTWSYAVLADTHRMSGYPSVEDLRRFISLETQPGPDNERRGPLAVVATNSVMYGIACAYAALAGSRRRVQVFRHKGEAINWLDSLPPVG